MTRADRIGAERTEFGGTTAPAASENGTALGWVAPARMTLGWLAPVMASGGVFDSMASGWIAPDGVASDVVPTPVADRSPPSVNA